jgi:phosphohistidine phosphatase
VRDRLRLYVTRHGKAEPESSTGRDEDRPLRKKGEKQAEYLAAHLLAADRHPHLILSSRLRRAVETTRVLSEAMGCPAREEPTLGLGHPVSEVIEVLELLARQRAERDVMLVGHNPQLEYLVGTLTDGPATAGVRMRTGECAILEFESDERILGGARLLDMVRLASAD